MDNATRIELLKSWLHEYVSKNNSIDNLNIKDDLYKKIKGLTIRDNNGVNLNFAEKIKLAGFNYTPKYKSRTENVELNI